MFQGARSLTVTGGQAILERALFVCAGQFGNCSYRDQFAIAVVADVAWQCQAFPQ
ncbi:MAG: hypothetical protein ACLTEE_01950 [Anaerobutyricum hallii]